MIGQGLQRIIARLAGMHSLSLENCVMMNLIKGLFMIPFRP
jgi:hypothetical protein